jgi:LPXTG-site transpeptidase (sortase) family protein
MARNEGSSHGRTAHRWLAHLALIGVTAGFTLASAASSASGPVPEARAAAEAALTQQLVAPGLAAVLPSDQRFELVPGAEFVSRPGGATRIRVGALGIDAEVRPVGIVFREGHLQYDTPTVEAGHYAGTADPGTAGNMVIGGHVSLRGGTGVFKALPGVAIGQTIEVLSDDQSFRYQVTEVRLVAPTATQVMEPTSEATLTLITCSNDNAHAQRIVVVGKLV